MDAIRRRAPAGLATLFGASGIIHLLRPKTFDGLIPRWVPNPRGVIYLSGIAELISAIGLARRSRWSRAASVAVLTTVFPGNVQMAVTAARESRGHMSWSRFFTLARLPLQIGLIWAALQSGKSDTDCQVFEQQDDGTPDERDAE